MKVVGPEPEPRELLFHKQAQVDLNDPHTSIKKEPPSLTSTPRKKAHFALGDEASPVQTPKVQSRSTAKLTNMFAEDLLNSEEKPSTMPYGQSPTINTYNMCFTVSDAAGDYDLFAPNRRHPNNNNNNNANRGRPGRGQALRGVGPAEEPQIEEHMVELHQAEVFQPGEEIQEEHQARVTHPEVKDPEWSQVEICKGICSCQT